MLKLETILNESMWVVKMVGWRTAGTWAEVGHLAKDEDCRDFDLAAKQPDHLKEFFDAYFAHEREHGFLTIPEFYEKHYAEAAKEADYLAIEREAMAMY